jgi:PiT family inorganic phosphate transporter
MDLTIIFALIVSFYVAWNIGANDAANSMATSYGSRALTLRQLVILCAILEFLGEHLFLAKTS